MFVELCKVRFIVHESGGLKQKRKVVQSVKDRVRNRFNVAIAEVGCLDSRNEAELGVACVSNDGRHAQSVISSVMNYIESSFPITVVSVETDLW